MITFFFKCIFPFWGFCPPVWIYATSFRTFHFTNTTCARWKLVSAPRAVGRSRSELKLCVSLISDHIARAQRHELLVDLYEHKKSSKPQRVFMWFKPLRSVETCCFFSNPGNKLNEETNGSRNVFKQRRNKVNNETKSSSFAFLYLTCSKCYEYIWFFKRTKRKNTFSF